MNSLMIPGCNNAGQEQAQVDLIERSLLFNDESKSLFIKSKDDLIGIGGSVKQNKLIEGDNIEFVGTETEPIVRLKDDITVKTLTILPEEGVPAWKGSYLIGELSNGNSVFLLCKETAISDKDQGILGGSLLVKMESTEGEEVLAQYAITITSTGSWSLWGGCNLYNNVRVCRAKYQDEWYYGLKIPDMVETTTSDQATTETQTPEHVEFWFNGWKDIPESLVAPQVDTDQLEFQVLARESQDADSFAEVFITNSSTPISTIANNMKGLQELGEDAPPYKWIIGGRSLTKSDLKTIAASCKNPDRQIVLDLSQCWMANNNQDLNELIFENCSSLRGLIMPQRITHISTGIFVWCTYLRLLDLRPSANTLKQIGIGKDLQNSWNQSIGTFTSTRIRDLMVPKNITTFNAYMVYSSNLTNFILLHDQDSSWPESGYRTWAGIPLGQQEISGAQTLPKGFHMFIETKFYNKHPTDWHWGNDSAWHSTIIANPNLTGLGNPDSYGPMVIFNKDWTQETWQQFNDIWHWGEELINNVRSEFGKTDYIEILE